MTLWLFVLARILSNPVSNVFQKILTRRGSTSVFIIFVTFALVCLFSLFLVPSLVWPVASRFWLDIILATFLAVAGNAALVAALRRSDLSVLGPVNAYKSIVSLLPGIVFLHEIPTFWQLAGIGLIVAGSFLVLGRDSTNTRWSVARALVDRGVQWRFLALIFSAIEAVFLKRALLASSPEVTFTLWSFLGFGWVILLIPSILRSAGISDDLAVLRENKAYYLFLGITTGIMQFSTLVTLQFFTVGPALALFQTSTLLTVILGRTVFSEGHFFKRLMGSFVMVAGAVLIIIFR